MVAVILAAGAGRRLAPMGWSKPKCLLPCGTSTLLDNALSALAERQVRDVVVVVGYQRGLVEAALRKHRLRSESVVNDEFATTNTLYSLYLARGHLGEGFLLLNADVLFDPAILDLLPISPARLDVDSCSILAVDNCSRDAEAVKVLTDAEGRITRIGKDVPASPCAGEFIGLARVDRSACAALIQSLSSLVDAPGGRSLYFESAIDAVLADHSFVAAPVGDLRAVEIDTPEDYERAKKLFGAE
ncbi:MAG: phosphocholine cytidylyltransferase family protein [Planctomycetota bacterium]